MPFSGDPTEAEPESEAESTPATAERRVSFREPVSQHLEAALETDDTTEKDYHIRSALQRVMIAEQNRPD
jgi:hypothetical protein